MANANFNLIGTLRPMKENGFTVNKYDSGWINQKLRFTVTAGENRHFVEINAGKWMDDNRNTIYAYSEPASGGKSQQIQIEWDKRNDPETIKGVAGWRVFTVDLDNPGHRNELKENGDKEALEASYEKRHHFLAGTDFCDFVNSVINDPQMKDVKFRVKGNINYNYNDNTGRYYETYEVNKIYMVNEDEEFASEVNLDFYFDEDAFDDSMFEENGKANINGYTMFYDNATKKNWFTPITLVARDKVAGWKKTFSKFEDDEVRKIGLICQKINGAQRVNITVADLDEETQENIAWGLISEEDAIREAGGQMFGDAIREMRIEKLGRGYSRGSETTAWTAADLTKKPVKEEEEVEDIFEEDDDL